MIEAFIYVIRTLFRLFQTNYFAVVQEKKLQLHLHRKIILDEHEVKLGQSYLFTDCYYDPCKSYKNHSGMSYSLTFGQLKISSIVTLWVTKFHHTLITEKFN